MNVLIINPPAADGVRIVREGRCMQRQEAWGTSWAPLTLALVAAILRDCGFNVKLFDCSNDLVSFEELKKEIIDFGADLIIANTATPSVVSDCRVASLAREVRKGLKVIFFGIHVTALPEETFALNPDVEYLALGEPEYTLRDFAVALRGGTPLKQVRGLMYREGKELVRTEDRPLIENLDELPYPAWDLVNVKGYRLPITGLPFLLVLIGRGCPYRCTFCAAEAFYGNRPRLRSWQRVVAEIRYVQDKFKVNDFLFWSENTTIGKQQLYEISRELAGAKPPIRWVCNGRIDMVDENLLAAMKAGGCCMIGFGIESGSQRVLDMMRKDVKIENIERAVTLTRKVGIEVVAHVIVGYPGETVEDIEATARFVKRFDFDYIQTYCCVPFPGSEVYREAKQRGWIVSEDWSRFEQNFSVITTPQLSCERVMRLREELIRNFYLNPAKIFKMIRKVKSLRELRCFFHLVFGYFFSWA